MRANKMKILSARYSQGFSLIEMMVVVMVIGILSAIFIPTYQFYMQKSAERSCLYEAKAYANNVFVAIQDRLNGAVVLPHKLSACKDMDSGVGWVSLDHTITANPKNPGVKKIVCDLRLGASCSISN